MPSTRGLHSIRQLASFGAHVLKFHHNHPSSHHTVEADVGICGYCSVAGEESQLSVSTDSEQVGLELNLLGDFRRALFT